MSRFPIAPPLPRLRRPFAADNDALPISQRVRSDLLVLAPTSWDDLMVFAREECCRWADKIRAVKKLLPRHNKMGKEFDRANRVIFKCAIDNYRAARAITCGAHYQALTTNEPAVLFGYLTEPEVVTAHTVGEALIRISRLAQRGRTDAVAPVLPVADASAALEAIDKINKRPTSSGGVEAFRMLVTNAPSK